MFCLGIVALWNSNSYEQNIVKNPNWNGQLSLDRSNWKHFLFPCVRFKVNVITLNF